MSSIENYKSKGWFGFIMAALAVILIWFASQLGSHLDAKNIFQTSWGFAIGFIAAAFLFILGVYFASAAMAVWRFSGWLKLMGYIILVLSLRLWG